MGDTFYPPIYNLYDKDINSMDDLESWMGDEFGGFWDEWFPYPEVPTPASEGETPMFDMGGGIGEWGSMIDNIFAKEAALAPELMELQWKLQQKYAPKLMEQQYSLETEYALKKLQDYFNANMEYMPKFAELEKSVNEALYPETAGLQENLAGQATRGMEEKLPDWARESYLSNMGSLVGTNVGSPIAADYTSRGLLELQKGWNDYYRDLALTVSGRQPLTTASTIAMPTVQTPQVNGLTGWTQDFTPQSSLGIASNNYGSYTNALANMYGSYTNAYSNLMSSNYATGSQNTQFDANFFKQIIGTIGNVIGGAA